MTLKANRVTCLELSKLTSLPYGGYFGAIYKKNAFARERTISTTSAAVHCAWTIGCVTRCDWIAGHDARRPVPSRRVSNRIVIPNRLDRSSLQPNIDPEPIHSYRYNQLNKSQRTS